MKNEQMFTALLAMMVTSAGAGAQEAPDATVHGDPYIPVGTLSVNPTHVQTGVKPNLDWRIEYPTTFDDIALVGLSGGLETLREVEIEVRRGEETLTITLMLPCR